MPVAAHVLQPAHVPLDVDPDADAYSVTGPGTIPPPDSVDPRVGQVAGTR